MSDKIGKIIPPFKMQILTNFPYIEADFDAITNYQLLCKVVEYLNKVIGNENELTIAFNNLYNYVSNYFDNLDVQDEINNKLDEMAESGELADIIAGYVRLKAVLVYNNVSEMKEADNLVNGSIARTLGYNSYNDKGGAYYKIREIINTDIVDDILIISLNNENLIAELVPSDENNIKVFNDNIKIGIENSKTLYLNNDTYTLELSTPIVKSNINIIGDSSIINSSSNSTYLFNISNASIKNITFNEDNITDKTKNILFTGNNLVFENCIFNSTVTYSNNSIENVYFKKCEFKSYYREIYMGAGKLNNLKIENCKFTRAGDYSSPYAQDSRILIYNINGTEAISETDLSNYGNNITIVNNEFSNTNKRDIHILNCHNVIIENNIFNSSGLDSSVVGGSDDLVSIDFVEYFKINNNYFGESGENELDLLSSKYGEVCNNKMEKSYDQFAIDINWSDYVRTFGESLTDRSLLKNKDIMIKNNTINSNTFTFNITPSDNIHIYNNNIINNVSTNIIIFDDFGTLTPATKSNLTITNLDIGENNVKTSLGDFGKIYVRDTYDYVITNESGHLSKDICCYTSQTATATTLTYTTNGFPCKHGEAGKLISLDGSFRSVTPSLVRWQNSQSIRRGIDFIGNRYNTPYWNSIFYTGDYLDKYPLGQDEGDNGSYNGTETTGTIGFKSW